MGRRKQRHHRDDQNLFDPFKTDAVLDEFYDVTHLQRWLSNYDRAEREAEADRVWTEEKEARYCELCRRSEMADLNSFREIFEFRTLQWQKRNYPV